MTQEESIKNLEELVDSGIINLNTIEEMNQGFYVTCLETGQIIYANKKFREIFDISEEENYKEISVKDFYRNNNDRKELIKNIEKEGMLNNYLVEIITKEGKNKIVKLSAKLGKKNKKSLI